MRYILTSILASVFIFTSCANSVAMEDGETDMRGDANPTDDTKIDITEIHSDESDNSEITNGEMVDFEVREEDSTGESDEKSPIGEPCENDEDCLAPEGLTPVCLTNVISYIRFPNGYCSAVCPDVGTCGLGNECIIMEVFGIVISYCFKRCSSPDECRVDEGYTCSTIPAVTEDTYCVPDL